MSTRTPHSDGIRWRNLKTGIVFVAGLALAAWLGLFIGKNTGLLMKHHYIQIFTNDIAGLVEGNPVSISGKKIGTVKRMEFTRRDSTNGVLITLDIFGEYYPLLSKDSKATIKAQGFLGDKYVDITIGKLAERLQEGDSLAFTTEDVMGEMIATAKGTMGNIEQLTAKMNSGEGTLGQLLTTTRLSDDLHLTLANLNTVTGQLTKGKGIAPQLLNDPGMAANIASLVSNLNNVMESLKGDGAVGKLVLGQEFLTNLTHVTARTDSLLATLTAKNNSLSAFTNDQSVFTNVNGSIMQLQKAMTSLDSLFIDIKENPDRYIRLRLF